MFKLIVYGFVVYLLYKFIFELVIPVSKATSQVKDRFREMQEQQQQAQNQAFQQQQRPSEPTPPNSKNKEGDYIEFEEIH